MKNKRLISLMLAGVMTTSVGVMAGCSGCLTDDTYRAAEIYKNRYIILEDKDGKDILHKGDFGEGYKDANNGFDLECAEFFITNRKHTTYDNKPAETEYDEQCEQCFNND